jgi:hypothetical protein
MVVVFGCRYFNGNRTKIATFSVMFFRELSSKQRHLVIWTSCIVTTEDTILTPSTVFRSTSIKPIVMM